MAKCKNCKGEITGTDIYCKSCGEKIESTIYYISQNIFQVILIIIEISLISLIALAIMS